MERVYNFSAGPATLPLEVLQEAQAEFVNYKGSGMSIIESSHRGKEYDAVHQEAVANITQLLGLDDRFAVLFLQGGASGQFAMIPMNFLGEGQSADYINSGTWATKAIKEAKNVGNVNVIADTSKDIPTILPTLDSLSFTQGAAYVHMTSNETIAGTQWKKFPKTEAPLIADMSSDILSRRFDPNLFGLFYAGAQKNLGPAGVTLVIINKELAEKGSTNIPAILRYKTQIDANSLYNTPPCFSIYVVMLMTRWLLKQGGLDAVEKINQDKAGKVYHILDTSEFYKGTADKACRSDMNITFRLPSEDLEKQFIEKAANEGMKGLKGHRSVGGIRASIYNAFSTEGIDALVSFMELFEKENG